ncbi:hypothetical protein diail_686 [Diaporthe ilicicola]|nr:hypothetical protein diail_686 [Diaporthe ilicicola]
MDTSPRHSRKGSSGLFERSIPLMALTLPTLASIALVSASHLRVLGSTREDIQLHRTTVSVLVQVLSATLGILQVTTLTAVISAGFRLRLAARPMQLDTISLFNAVIVPRIPWGLSLQKVLLAAVMVVLSQGPGALWAGALTPTATSAEAMLGSVAVPAYTNATADVWDSEFRLNDEGDVWNYVQNCTAVRGSDGTLSTTSISNCPVPNFQAQLLASARDASAGGGITRRNHSKPDSPAWTYRGRSYGVGAAQGLTPPQGVPADHDLLSYTYNETGYQTTVACELNATASLNFTLSSWVDNVDIWEVNGTLPNSIRREFYPVMAWHRDSLDGSAVLAWAGVSNNDAHMIGVVASEIYGNFSNLQCRVTFEPTLFNVNVNNAEQTINVSVVDAPIRDVADIDQTGTGHLRSNAIRSVNLLSRMSTSLYVSILGEALTHNLQTVSARVSDRNDGNDPAGDATADSFTAMLDDILGIYGGSQLVLADRSSAGQTATDLRGSFAALQIGQPRYQWAVLAVNAALLLLMLIEGLRTRWWRGLPCFDTLDFGRVVEAALPRE